MAKRLQNRDRKVLDEIDYEILSIVQKDCKLNADELSLALKDRGHILGAQACLNRVKRLEQEGIIKYNRAIVDRRKLGYPGLFIMMVKMRDKSDKEVNEFLESVEGSAFVFDIYAIIGDYDFIMKVAARSVEEATLISRSFSKYADISTHAVGQIYKETTIFEPHRSVSPLGLKNVITGATA